MSTTGSESILTAYLFPGQGSQEVGMGADLAGRYASAREVFSNADRILGFSLSTLCFDGPDDDLTATANAQPAILTASLACLAAAREASGETLPIPGFVAGHSLGEYTALVAAGACDFATGLGLARERGRLMQEAGRQTPGAMAAVIGLDEADLRAVCHDCDVWIANLNCPGQVVISGATDHVRRASALARERGARMAVLLPVSGAFHTPLMQPAAEGIRPAIAAAELHNPAVPVIANTTATPMYSAADIRTELADQLCGCVRWEDTIRYLLDQGVTRFIEFGPGQVLSGMTRRIDPSVSTLSVGDLDSLDEFLEAIR